MSEKLFVNRPQKLKNLKKETHRQAFTFSITILREIAQILVGKL